MTDYVGLAAQIVLPAYAGMTDAQIVAALNAATVTVGVDVPGQKVKDLTLTTGEWGKIKALTLPGATIPAGATQALIINFVDTCESSTFQTSNATVLADVTAGLAAFVAASLIAATTQTALMALTSTTTSEAALLGFPNGVAVADLAAARLLA